MAVQALTKNDKILSKEECIIDSLTRINRLQREVGIAKIADRITNLQAPPKYSSQEKAMAYCEEAKLISVSLSNKNDYLNKRLSSKIIEYEHLIKTS